MNGQSGPGCVASSTTSTLTGARVASSFRPSCSRSATNSDGVIGTAGDLGDAVVDGPESKLESEVTVEARPVDDEAIDSGGRTRVPEIPRELTHRHAASCDSVGFHSQHAARQRTVRIARWPERRHRRGAFGGRRGIERRPERSIRAHTLERVHRQLSRLAVRLQIESLREQRPHQQPHLRARRRAGGLGVDREPAGRHPLGTADDLWRRKLVGVLNEVAKGRVGCAESVRRRGTARRPHGGLRFD
jgi:hypothetical protein